MSVRFVHTGDWQLGMTRHFLDADAQATFGQARIDAIRTIGKIAAEEKAEFVVVAGDVFETNRVATRTVRRAFEALESITVPVFLLPGNHDPLDAGSVFRSPTFVREKPENVTVLENPQPIEVRPGVEIVGAPWRSKRPLDDLVRAVCGGLESRPGLTRILVAHGAIDDVIALDNPALIGRADAEAAVNDGRIAYLALGDRHSTTEVGRTGRIRYAGSPEPTDYDEDDPGNVLLVELGDGACTVTPKRTGEWRFVRERFELNGDADLAALGDWLNQQEPKERMIVKLSLVGTLSLSENDRLQETLDHARDTFAAVEEWERHSDLVVRPEDDDFSDLALAGYAGATVEELRARAATGGEAAAAADALALLVRLARGTGEASA